MNLCGSACLMPERGFFAQRSRVDLGGPVCLTPERGCLLRGAEWTSVVQCV